MKMILKKMINTKAENAEKKKIEFSSIKENDESLTVRVTIEGNKKTVSEFMDTVNTLDIQEELELEFGRNKQTRLTEIKN